MKTTRYFELTRSRPDREMIEDAWIDQVIRSPMAEQRQADGRLKRWAKIDAAGGRILRVVLLADEVTVHNAVFDRGFRP